MPSSKQLTLRGVDARLDRSLRAEARRRGLSVNRTVLRLLQEATGLAPSATEAVAFDDLDHLAGVWSAEEAAAFDERLGSFRRVDAELW